MQNEIPFRIDPFLLIFVVYATGFKFIVLLNMFNMGGGGMNACSILLDAPCLRDHEAFFGARIFSGLPAELRVSAMCSERFPTDKVVSFFDVAKCFVSPPNYCLLFVPKYVSASSPFDIS